MRFLSISTVPGSQNNPPAITPPGPAPSCMPTAEQTLFLKRFEDLLEKRRLHARVLPENDWRRRLIDKALYSAYRDCLDLDVRDEVRDILGRGRSAARLKPLQTA